MATQTYYFDMKDGVTVRDRIGKQFASIAEAIAHSEALAERFRHEHAHDEPDLSISVISESGAEVHRERIHPLRSIRKSFTVPALSIGISVRLIA